MENDVAAQLAAITDTRAAVADRIVTPGWYHPVLGLLIAAYVIGLGLGNIGVKLASGVLFCLAAGALARAYRQRTGVWVSGLEAGRAGRWAGALGAMVGVVAITAWALGAYTDLWWLVLVLAVVS